MDLVDYSVNLFQEYSFELSSRNVTAAISVDFLEKFGSFVTLKRKRIRTELNSWQGLVISEISIDAKILKRTVDYSILQYAAGNLNYGIEICWQYASLRCA